MLSPREQAAASAIAGWKADQVDTERGDLAEIEAFYAGWRLGNGYDRGVEPDLAHYEDWRRQTLEPVLPKLWVRCDTPGIHAGHHRVDVVDGVDTDIHCSGEAREEDLTW